MSFDVGGDTSGVDTEDPAVLVEQILAGAPGAQQRLVDRYWRSLLFLLNRRSDDPQLANDIAQDTFITVLGNIREGKLDDPQKLGAYIRSIGNFLLIAHFRKQSRQDTHTFDHAELDVPSKSPSLFQVLNGRKALAQVQQLIDEMSKPRDKQILLDYYLKEKSKATICDEMALAPEHFDRVLYRARNRLKQLIAHHYGDDLNPLVVVGWLLLAAVMLAVQRDEPTGEIFFAAVVTELNHSRHTVERVVFRTGNMARRDARMAAMLSPISDRRGP